MRGIIKYKISVSLAVVNVKRDAMTALKRPPSRMTVVGGAPLVAPLTEAAFNSSPLPPFPFRHRFSSPSGGIPLRRLVLLMAARDTEHVA